MGRVRPTPELLPPLFLLAPACAILESIGQRRGDQIAIVFSRQAGKDEMLTQLLAFLLLQRSRHGGTAIIAAPTFRPQAILSRDRLRDRLLGNGLTGSLVTAMDSSTIRLGGARARFVSAAPGANEAQDIEPRIWDAVFDPMAASTNATTFVTAERRRIPLIRIEGEIGAD